MLIITGIYSYNHWYAPYRNLKNGFVYSKIWDCPDDHPIKANMNSGIYHTKSSPYYKRTSGRNSKCFDTKEHAEVQGFRAPYK